jgi:hypothetical protein
MHEPTRGVVAGWDSRSPGTCYFPNTSAVLLPKLAYKRSLVARSLSVTVNMDDLFGSAHELEQSHIQEGARDGKRCL